MSPADILAAARQNVVGPYLPARREWLDGWCGPLTADVEHYGVGLSCIQAPGRHGPMMGLFEVHFRFGGIVMDAEVPLSTIRLDTRIPAVRDHLVRLGCPEWARDVPAAVWAWGTNGKAPRMVLGAWDDAWAPRMDRWSTSPVNGVCASTMIPDRAEALEDWAGWMFRLPANSPSSGPETGDEGRACADVAALNAGCILRVEGGWLVPLPGDGVGYFKEVSRDE